MNAKWSGLILGFVLVAIANIGAFWFGKSFKFGIAVLVVSAFAMLWLWIRHKKEQLVRDLIDADPETQNRILEGLDAEDRNEILRKLGRDS